VKFKDRREQLERDPFLGILLTVALGVVLVFSVEDFLFHILIQRCVKILAALDWNLQVIEIFVTLRLVGYVDAANIIGKLPTKEMGHCPLNRGALHLLLELVD